MNKDLAGRLMRLRRKSTIVSAFWKDFERGQYQSFEDMLLHLAAYQGERMEEMLNAELKKVMRESPLFVFPTTPERKPQ
jgi:hypothetical protein